MFKTICFFISLLLSLFFIKQSLCEEKSFYYFDFKTNTSIVPYSGEIEISMEYTTNIPEELSFKFRPILENGMVMIIGEDQQTWLLQNNSWNKMPRINESTRLKIHPIGSTVNLHFEIKNPINEEIYETPKKTLNTLRSYNYYKNRLNTNLKEWRGGEQTESTEKKDVKNHKMPDEIQSQTENPKISKGSVTKIIVHLTAFSLSSVAGFIREDDKMLLCEELPDIPLQ